MIQVVRQVWCIEKEENRRIQGWRRTIVTPPSHMTFSHWILQYLWTWFPINMRDLFLSTCSSRTCIQYLKATTVLQCLGRPDQCLHWLMSISCCNGCYRCLGTSTFFPTSTLFTISSLMGHDHDEGILSEICSEHCLLRLSLTTPFSFLYHFHFGLTYILISMIMLHIALTSSCLCLHNSMIMLLSPPHNYAYPLISFLLIDTDIAFLAALSLYAAL